MGEGMKQMIHDVVLQEEEEDQSSEKTTFTGDSSTVNLMDDACSSSSDSLVSPMEKKDDLDSNGPLYELSSLIAQLPIRSLSKYYQGKSQSFTSLSEAKCTEDLAKKEIEYNRRMKMRKTFKRGSDNKQRPTFLPGPCRKIISKKQSRGKYY